MSHGHFRHSRIGNLISARRRLEAELHGQHASSDLLEDDSFQTPIIPATDIPADENCDSSKDSMCLEHDMDESDSIFEKRDESTSVDPTSIKTVLQIVDASSQIPFHSTTSYFPMTTSGSMYATDTLSSSDSLTASVIASTTASLSVTASASASIDLGLTSPTPASITQPTSSSLSGTSLSSSFSNSIQTSLSATNSTSQLSSALTSASATVTSSTGTSTRLVTSSSSTPSVTTSPQAHNYWSYSGASSGSGSSSTFSSSSSSNSTSTASSSFSSGYVSSPGSSTSSSLSPSSISGSSSSSNSSSSTDSNSSSGSGFSSSVGSSTSSTSSTSQTTSSSGVYGGSGLTGSATDTGTAPTTSETHALGQESTSNPDTPKIVGGVVGSVAGLALILFLLFYYLRRRGFLMGKTGRPNMLGDATAAAGAGAGAGAGVGAGAGSREMVERRESNDPLFTARYLAPAFIKRWRQSTATARSGSTVDSGSSERGFQKISGRKLPPVFTHGGDGYGGGVEGDSPTIPGFPTHSPATGSVGSPSVYAPPPTSPYGVPLDSNYTREVEEHTPPTRPKLPHLPVSNTVNVSTPITVTPAHPVAQPQSAVPFLPPRPDGLGRSLHSFDGSRSSRFTEVIDQ